MRHLVDAGLRQPSSIIASSVCPSRDEPTLLALPCSRLLSRHSSPTGDYDGVVLDPGESLKAGHMTNQEPSENEMQRVNALAASCSIADDNSTVEPAALIEFLLRGLGSDGEPGKAKALVAYPGARCEIGSVSIDRGFGRWVTGKGRGAYHWTLAKFAVTARTIPVLMGSGYRCWKRARGRTGRKIRRIAFPPILRGSRRFPAIALSSIGKTGSRSGHGTALHRPGPARSVVRATVRQRSTISGRSSRSAALAGRRGCVCFAPPALAGGQHRNPAHKIGGKKWKQLASQPRRAYRRQARWRQRAKRSCTTLLGGTMEWLRDSYLLTRDTESGTESFQFCTITCRMWSVGKRERPNKKVLNHYRFRTY